MSAFGQTTERVVVCLVAASGVLLSGSGAAAEELPAAARIKTLLAAHCVECHGPEKEKGDLRIDQLEVLRVAEQTDLWAEILDQLNLGEMPPEDESHLSEAERAELTDWVTAELRRALMQQRGGDGSVPLRRLSRQEYNYTLQDLLGIAEDVALTLPQEGASEDGFKNNAEILRMSASHLQSGMRFAREALAMAIVTEPQPTSYRLKIEPEMPGEPISKTLQKAASAQEGESPNPYIKLFAAGPAVKLGIPIYQAEWDAKLLDGNPVPAAFLYREGLEVTSDGVILPPAESFEDGGFSKGLFLPIVHWPDSGRFAIGVKVAAHQLVEGRRPPRLRVEFGTYVGRDLNVKVIGEADLTSTAAEWLVFRGDLATIPRSDRTGRDVIYLTNIYERGTLDSGSDDEVGPTLLVDAVEWIMPEIESWPPPSHRRIFNDSANRSNQTVYAGEVLEAFMRRAYRRPVTGEELASAVEFFQQLRPVSESFEAAISGVLVSVLSSPHFLYIAEPTSGESKELNAHQLATRLSYFLWRSMPDDTLMALADSGDLENREVLLAQVDRLLDDPKSERMIRSFTSEWLHLDGLDGVAINPEVFPFFKEEEMKATMKEETIRFVDHVFRHDLSALNLLDSDFAILDPVLARHYQIPGVDGGGFRRVALRPEDHRGGLLSQGSILTANSTGDGTHPVLRGTWVLSNLLNSPPPPPPPNVPQLDQDPDILSKPFVERLALHRQQEGCANCHKKIDPWGVAFEQYSGVGKWQGPGGTMTEIDVNEKKQAKLMQQIAKGKTKALDRQTLIEVPLEDPVVFSETLPKGEVVTGLDDVKQLLSSNYKDQFADCLAHKVLAFSLGRNIDVMDAEALEEISTAFEQNDYRLRALIRAVITSERFLSK